MNVLSFDTGKTIGWAIQNEERLIDQGQIEYKDFAMWLFSHKDKPIDVVVVEHIQIIPGKEHLFIKEHGTIRAIGQIELFALMINARLVKSPTTRNPQLAKQTGVDGKKGAHSKTHWAYAYNHGAGYLIDMGLYKFPYRKGLKK